MAGMINKGVLLAQTQESLAFTPSRDGQAKKRMRGRRRERYES